MNDKKYSLKLDSRGRITIPSHVREYFELPDPEAGDVWIEVTVHGLDENKLNHREGGE